MPTSSPKQNILDMVLKQDEKGLILFFTDSHVHCCSKLFTFHSSLLGFRITTIFFSVFSGIVVALVIF